MQGKIAESRAVKDGLDIQELPRPSQGRGGNIKLMLTTLIALSLTGAAVFWFTRDEGTKTELKSRITEHFTAAVKDTPLEHVTKYLTPPPPPPPPSVVKPKTAPGTLSGQVIQSPVPSPVDTGTDGEPPVPENVVPKVQEDSVVRGDFVRDVAGWMVSRYHPQRGVNWSVSAINMRYGVKMHGLTPRGTEDALSGRAALLRYAFNPSMLTALYGIYADRFVEELGQAAAEPSQGTPLSAEHTDAMYKAYAGRFEALAGVLQGIGAMTDFQSRMQGLTKLTQQSLTVHTQVAEAVFALDEAREAKNTTGMEAAQLRVTGLNAQYQRILAERSSAQQSLVSSLRQAAPAARSFDEDTTMFIAAWVERRMEGDAQASQSVLTASRLLDDLAGKMRKAASIAR